MNQTLNRLFLHITYFCALIFIIKPACAEPQLSEDKIRIGVVLPLTGALAEYGTAARNGIALAQKEYKEQLANVEFIFEDSQFDNKATVTACKKLWTVDKAKLEYVWGYGPAAACAAIADSNKMAVIAVSSDPEVERGRRYVVRFATSIEKHSAVLIEHLKNVGASRIAILASDIPFFTGIIGGMKSRLSGAQKIVLVETVQPEDMDLKSSVTRIRNAAPDVIGVFLLSNQIGQFYKNAVSLGMARSTFGTDFFDSESEVANALPGIKGAVFPAPDITAEFREQYKSEFGSTTQLPYAANAFDFAALVAASQKRGSSEEMLDYFRSVDTVKGASGEFTYRREGEFSPGYDFNVILKKVNEQGKIVTVSE